MVADGTHTNYLTLTEAARHISVSEKTLRRRISEGRLTEYRMGSRNIRVSRAEVESLLVQIPPSSAA